MNKLIWITFVSLLLFINPIMADSYINTQTTEEISTNQEAMNNLTNPDNRITFIIITAILIFIFFKGINKKNKKRSF